MVAATQASVSWETVRLALPSPLAIFEAMADIIWLDTEFTSLDWQTSKLISVQYARASGNPVVVDTRHMTKAQIRRMLLNIVGQNTTIVAHNANADLHMLAQYDVWPYQVMDTQVMALLLEGRGGYYSLADAVHQYCPYVHMDKEVRNVFIDMDQRPEDWNRPFTDEEREYMQRDVEALRELYTVLTERLKGAPQCLEPVLDLEHRLIPVIVRMENAGLCVDVAKWRAYIQDADKERQRLEEELGARLGVPWAEMAARRFETENATLLAWADAKVAEEQRLRTYHSENMLAETGMGWGEFKKEQMRLWRDINPRPVIKKPDALLNLGSSAQLVEAFQVAYNVELASMAAPYLSEKLPSLSGEVAETIRLLLDYKAASKLVTAFGEPFLAHVGPDGRIHARFNAMGTDTGRMSCDSPNLQQIPRPRKLLDLRSCIRAPEGRVLLVADLSNAELRILANESQDAGMLAIFERGEDMHSAVARKMFGLHDDQNPKELFVKDGVSYRHVAKTIAFGLAYGMGPGKLSATIGVDLDKARELISAFFLEFPQVKAYLERSAAFAQEHHYAKTKLGRIRRFLHTDAPPGIVFRNGRCYDQKRNEATSAWMERYAEIGRLGKNTPIQGGCADVVKLALVDLDHALRYNSLDAAIVSCIHDEIVVEVSKADAKFASHLLSQSMTGAFRRMYSDVRFDDVEVAEAETWVH